MRRQTTTGWACGLLALAAGSAGAAEPAYFSLTGEVRKALVLRAEPASTGRRIGEIPAGATGLENKGCRGASEVSWEHLSNAMRTAMAKERWCRIRYRSAEGWVAARYLRAGEAPPPEPAAARTPARPRAATRMPPKDASTFTGIEWRAARLGGFEPQAPTAWIRFDDNGDVEGHTGCNALRATFAAGATAMRLGPIAMTRVACAGEALAEQERQFVAALEAAEAHQVEAGILRLFDAGGAARAVFTSIRR